MSRGYEITPRAPEAGGGYNVTFLNEDGTVGGGGAFPLVSEGEDDYDAYGAAMETAAEWVGYREDQDEEARRREKEWAATHPWSATHEKARDLFGPILEEIESTRSKQFSNAVWEALVHRCGYEPPPKCPYRARTAEADAWGAGLAEGYNLWDQHRNRD